MLDASNAYAEHFPGLKSEKDFISKLFAHTTIVESALTVWPELRHQISVSEVFHFMGHGTTNGDGTGLVLSAKDSLNANDLAPNLLQHMRLSVLSACSTGRGQRDGLLDTQNLVRSFLAGGVPSVISSRWNFDSESTASLMNAFYEQLREHKTVAEAMYSARLVLLRSQPHPYYWAAFNLSGRPE